MKKEFNKLHKTNLKVSNCNFKGVGVDLGLYSQLKNKYTIALDPRVECTWPERMNEGGDSE